LPARTGFVSAPIPSISIVASSPGRVPAEGGRVYNVPGETVPMSEVVAAIEAEVPAAEIAFDNVALPFPEEFATGSFPMPVRPLVEGMRSRSGPGQGCESP
jgi:hypothetical protein